MVRSDLCPEPATTTTQGLPAAAVLHCAVHSILQRFDAPAAHHTNVGMSCDSQQGA